MKYLRKQSSSIPNLSHNNVVSTTNQEEANMLNDYFSKCSTYHNLLCKRQTALTNYPLADDCPDEILYTEWTLDDPWYRKSRWLWWYLCENVKRNWGAYISPSLTKNFKLFIKSRLFLHSWKCWILFQSQKSTANLTTGLYLYCLYLGQTIGETCSPHYCQACVHKPTVWQLMYSGDSKVESLP